MDENFEKEKIWLLDEKFGGEKCEAFFSDVEKLKNGEPLAFLISFVDFLNCKIDLEFKPLIPRVETEFWVNEFIKNEIKIFERNLAKSNFAQKTPVKILDIFSGSGCIGISLLKNLKNIKIDFSEINPNFIKQIKKNLEINNINNKKYNIFQSDVFEKIPIPKNENEKYNFILANPPYIPKNKFEKVQNSVKNFEDYNSLFANEDGLFFIKKLISEAPKFLKEDGKLFIEFDETSKKNIEKFLKKNSIKNYYFQKDQYKNNRVLIVTF